MWNQSGFKVCMCINTWGDTTHTDCGRTCRDTIHQKQGKVGNRIPSPRGPPCTPALPTELLHKLMPAPCPTNHCINPSPVQWALGPQRGLCSPPLPQSDHSPVPGLATSQNWRVLWGRPNIFDCWVQHIHQAEPLCTSHPWCWNKTPCTFERNKNSKLIPRTRYYSCSLRNSLQVCALQVINVLFTQRNRITITYPIYINISFVWNLYECIPLPELRH